MKPSNEYVIIVAGGIGSRMGNNIPKQFLFLKGKPILQHTIEAFFHYNPKINIILSIHPDYISDWQELIVKQEIKIPHIIVEGGKTRFHSVKNGLQKIILPGIIAIHDAARPFITTPLLKKMFTEVKEFGSCIPVLPMTNSIRKITDTENLSLNRQEYFSVQTPQLFSSKILQDAYKQQYNKSFTDDASVVEKLGFKIHTTEGLEMNIKITSPLDIEIAKHLLNKFT